MKLQYWKYSFHPLLATGGIGALDPIRTIAQAGMCKNLASSFGMNTNPDPGFGGFSNLGAKLCSPGGFWSVYFFNFPLKDSFIAYSDAAVFDYKSDWKTTVELWPGKASLWPPLYPHNNAGTQMWLPIWRGISMWPESKKHLTHLLHSHN